MRRSPSHDNNYYTSVRCVCPRVCGTRRHEIIERSLLVSAGTRVAAAAVFYPFVSVFFRPTRKRLTPGTDAADRKKTKDTTARVTIVIDTRLIIISDFYRCTALNGPTRAFCTEFRVEATAGRTRRTWTFVDAHRPKNSKNDAQTAVRNFNELDKK